jgi:hypothetical protein
MYAKKKKIQKVFDVGFDLVEKCLLQDLFLRTPGQLIGWDATF